MGKYNKHSVSTVEEVVNHQGGVGVSYAPKEELVAILASGLDNKFYEKESEREQRLIKVIENIAKTDVNFVAKALIYARSVMGQRSVTHRGAVELAKHLRGDKLAERFFSKRSRKSNSGGIVYRIDDMLEIAACYQAKNPEIDPKKIAAGKKFKPFSNAIKKGFKLALESADTYELAKYQGKANDISLIDICNLVHPKPSKEMESVFKDLMTGNLKQFNTVEDKNTAAGQEVAAKVKAGELTTEQAKTQLAEAKEDNYAELIKNRKIGYLALLRNLRNILKNSSDKSLITDTCNLLTDPKLIKQSLVFPHQIDLALEILLTEFSPSQMGQLVMALNKAYELAIPNLMDLFPSGRTAIVFDTSGSMTASIRLSNNKNGSESAVKKAALIAATLAKGIGGDVYHFANYCLPIRYNPADSVNTIKNSFLMNNGKAGGGTSFNCIMPVLENKYDRIFVISDMQSGDGLIAKNNAHIYSVDICGYGTTSIKPGKKIYQLFGYSAEIYELVKKVEIDPKAVIKAIEAINI